MIKPWDHPDPKEALVLIHLSSLDSFTDMEREATGGDENGFELAFRIAEVIKRFRGPIFIGDQQWLFVGRESRPRARLMDEIEEMNQKGPREWTPRITWVQFDEQDEGEVGWEKFLKKLEKWLKKNKITRVSLGGLYWDEGEGCVTHVERFLKKILPVKVLLEAVGSVEVIDELWTEAREKAREEGEDVEEPKKGELPGGYTHGEPL